MSKRFSTLLLTAGVAAVFAISAPALADPPPWAPAHGHRAKQHRYVYYPEYQVYYAPESRLWFWLDGRYWRTGVSLPTGLVLGGLPGVSVFLDTGRPYERHGYVVKRYGGDEWGDQHRHRRHDRHEDRHKHGKHNHDHRH